MDSVEKAVERFINGCSCAQAILVTFGPKVGLSETLASKLASGFGGGMGRLGNECGAVTAAMMILGLRFGPERAEDSAKRETVYQLVRQFAEHFQQEHGSLLCRELIPFDISTPEGLEQARKEKVFKNICPKYVKTAANILCRMLSQDS